MKKLFTLLLASAMVLTMASTSFAASTTANDPFALTPQADVLKKIPKATPKGQIIMGSTTDLDANFMYGWTNSSTNQDVKTLINGYSVVTYTAEGVFVVDPVVVKKWNATENKDGSKTYTYTINNNLVWNDGSKITAKDYVFAVLLQSSPQMKALEAQYSGFEIFVGYEDFYSGKTKEFSGVRLIDDYTFSLTIKAEELPNYYELGVQADCTRPYPMAVIAPGVKLTDSGKGATLSDEFTEALLRKTINDEKTGYRFAPKVTCGPYNFVSFDPSNKVATMTANPKFLGNYDSTKPQIDKLIIKRVVQATMIDELAAGSVDLLSGVNGGERIGKGLDLVDQNKVKYADYMRYGYGKIAFHCDFGPTQFLAVRQAIALCLDRDEFCRQFTGGYGVAVNGYYGASQWEYQENKDVLQTKLNAYSYNLDKAKELLVKDGWTLDEKGGSYVEGPGKIRYKSVDGKLMPLLIEWCSSENNVVTDLVATMLPLETEKIGMKINQNVVDFATLLKNYNRQGVEPKYSMYNLATGFGTISEMWYNYSTEDKYMGTWNANFIKDEQLYKIALDMKATNSNDKAGWAKKWVDFQIRWNELLPDLPLYSDQYHDFYNPKMENYWPQPTWQWRYAIQRAKIK